MTAIGIMKTLDDLIVFGTRGGAIEPINPRVTGFASGMLASPNGGSMPLEDVVAAINAGEDPVGYVLRTNEFPGEIGDFEIIRQRPVGVFYADPVNLGPSEYKLVNELEVKAEFDDLAETNNVAYKRWEGLVAEGVGFKDWGARLSQDGHPPDAWETRDFIAVPASEQGAISLLDDFPVPNSPEEALSTARGGDMALCPIGYGAAKLYADYLSENTS